MLRWLCLRDYGSVIAEIITTVPYATYYVSLPHAVTLMFMLSAAR